MQYLIDGYNFLFQLYEEVDPLRQKREEIIERLQDILGQLHLKVSIVFDSHMGAEALFFPRRFQQKDLEIIYTPSGQTADNYFLESLDGAKHNHTKTVVTSDQRLAKQIKALGAKVLSIEDFLSWILQKEKKHYAKERKILGDDPKEIARLMEIFEKKLREEDF